MACTRLFATFLLPLSLIACRDEPKATDAPGIGSYETGGVDGDDGSGDDGSVTDNTDGTGGDDTDDSTTGGGVFSAQGPDEVTAGASFDVGVTWTDGGGDVGGAVSLEVSPGEGVTVDGLTVTLTLAGDYTITASGDGVSDSFGVGVLAAEADVVELELESALVDAGTVAAPAWSVADAWGNPVTAVVTLSSSPEGITVVGDTLETGLAGVYVITAVVDGTAIYDNKTLEVAPGDAETLSVSVDADDAEVGDTVALTVSAEDAWGNRLGVGDVTWTATPPVGAAFDDNGVTFEADGVYTLTASTGGLSDSAGPVTVDSNGPLIALESPARAAYIEDDQVLVAGTVTDSATGVSSFTVNGSAVSVGSDGGFSATVSLDEGVNVIELVAADADGNPSDLLVGVLSGTFIEDGAVIEELIELRVDDAALAQMGDMVTDGVSLDGMEDAVAAGNPIWEESYSDCGPLDTFISADFESLDVGDLSADLNAISDKLRVTTTLGDMVIGVGGEYDYCGSGPYSIDSTVTADAVVVTTTLYVRADGDGAITATVNSSTVTTEGYASDFDDDALLSSLAGLGGVDLDTIVAEAVEAAALEAVEDALPAAVSDGLSAFELSQVVDLGGADMDLEAWIRDIELDADGMSLGLEGTIDATSAAGAPDTPGSLLVAADRPDLTGGGADLVFGLSLTTFDRMMHAAWQGGAFDQIVTHEDIGLDSSLVGLIFAGATTLELRISGGMAPVMSAGTGSDMYDFAMGELAVEAYGEVDGVDTHLASMAAFADGTVQLRLNGAGEIVMTTTLDTTRFDVLPDGAGDVDAAEGLEALLSTFGSTLTSGIVPTINLALPPVAGLSLDPYEVDVVGDDWAAVECAVD